MIIRICLTAKFDFKKFDTHSPTAGQSIAHIQTLNQLSKQVLTFRNSVPLSRLTVWLMMHLLANSLTSTLVYFRMTDRTQWLKQEGGDGCP